MGIKIASNFSPRFTKPLDDRQQFATLNAMKNFSSQSLSDGLISFCLENNRHYVYNSSNEVDSITGKWREFYLPINIRPYEPDAFYEKGEICYFQHGLYAAYEDIEHAPAVFDSTQWEIIVTNATVYTTSESFNWNSENKAQISLSSITPENPQIQIGYSLFDNNLIHGRVESIENGVVTVQKIDINEDVLNIIDYPSLDCTGTTSAFMTELDTLELVADKIMLGEVHFSDLPDGLTDGTVQISITKPRLGEYLIYQMILFANTKIYLWNTTNNTWELIGTDIVAGNDVSLTKLPDGSTQIDCFVDEIDGGLIEQ